MGNKDSALYYYSTDLPTRCWVLGLGSLRDKFTSFGWFVLETDSNSMEQILKTLDTGKAATGKGKPVCILMHTVMGQGVDFMEGTHEWHGIAPNDQQLEQALAQIPETLGDY